MDPTIPLVLDIEEAAQVLLGNVVLRPGGIPKVANMLTEKARTMRGERKKGKARTVQAWVGKKRTKGSTLTIKRERLTD